MQSPPATLPFPLRAPQLRSSAAPQLRSSACMGVRERKESKINE